MKSARGGWSLQGRLNLAAGGLFLVAAIALILAVNHHQRAAALRVSKQRANAILERNLAISAFYAEELGPAVARLAAQLPAGTAVFDPAWMVSSHAARSIDARVPSSRGVYYYKAAAIDARDPGSEADRLEREFLERAARDPSFELWSGEREIEGKPWFVVMRRGETLQRACLECHSTPEAAPAGLVERYGRVRGFGRREGELMSAHSVRIPLERAYAEANAFSLKLSATSLAVLGFAYLAQWLVQRRLLYRPLHTLQLGAVRLAARSTARVEPLPVPAARELRDVTVAFNAMAESIARNTEELEAQVEHRTRQLMEREAQLRHSQKMEAVGRLAGGVAHDFNNLLTAIRGNADLLAEELPEGTAQRGEVEEIRDAAARASSLTRQLLAFSRRDVPQHRAICLDTVVGQMARLLERLLPANVKLELDLNAAASVVSGDAGQLEQVVLNLVVNARDALPAGGHIRVETRRVEEGDGDAVPGGGPWVQLAVVDDGVGIDPAVVAHVFEPFFTTKPRDEGTGLGLATAYGVVQQHGGRIVVASRLGEGSSFRVYLPESSSGVEKGVAAAPPARDVRELETVLVVEDEPAVRRLVVSTLLRRGYRVLEAESAEEALRVAAAQPSIDLLITDIVLGGLAGNVLAEGLAADRPGLRVLLMSGYAPDGELRKQLGASGAAFLQKPFTPDELADRVAGVLRPAAPA